MIKNYFLYFYYFTVVREVQVGDKRDVNSTIKYYYQTFGTEAALSHVRINIPPPFSLALKSLLILLEGHISAGMYTAYREKLAVSLMLRSDSSL